MISVTNFSEVSLEMRVILSGGLLLSLIILVLAYKRLPKKLKKDRFALQWTELQAYCRDRSTWSDALLAADKLLDDALRRRKFKGKSMGERMVSAGSYFTSNDDLWFAHNLCKKLKNNDQLKLRESEVKAALIGFRQGLRDLGALQSEKPND